MQKNEFKFLEFSPILKRLYESKEVIDEEGKKHNIAGLSTINNIKLIRGIILKEKPSSTMEIGLAYGGSALTFLCTLKEINSSDFTHIAIDPYQKKFFGNSAYKLIRESGLDKYFTLFQEKSYLEMGNLIKKECKFDLIYIDGSHLFEDIFLDLYFSTILLKINGIVLFDDSANPNTRKVLNFIRNNYKLIFEEINYKKYDTSKKSFKKSLANSFG